MTSAALKHLSAVDPVMARLIRQIGPCELEPETRRSPFQSLVQAVAHQQLHGRAAGNILSRFRKLFPGRRFPRAEDLAKVTDEQIRACGFSFAKIRSIRDIAEKTLSGVVPNSRQIVKLTDDEIIARLTAVRGVGRWTVEMLLIFQLGRPDALGSVFRYLALSVCVQLPRGKMNHGPPMQRAVLDGSEFSRRAFGFCSPRGRGG